MSHKGRSVIMDDCKAIYHGQFSASFKEVREILKYWMQCVRQCETIKLSYKNIGATSLQVNSLDGEKFQVP